MRSAENLAQGVTYLPVWYQLLCFTVTVLLLWYAEEAASMWGLYSDIYSVVITPILKSLRVDMYLSADYREMFGELMLRHQMLMIVQSVVLLGVYLILRRFATDEAIARQLTESKTARVGIHILDIAEVLTVIKTFATKEVLQEMIPRLEATAYDNLIYPCIKWGSLIGSWWLANVVFAAVIAMLYRVALLVITRKLPPREKDGIRWYVMAFLLVRPLISIFWWQVDPGNPYVSPSSLTFCAMILKTVFVFGCINVQNQEDAASGEEVGVKYWDETDITLGMVAKAFGMRFRILLFKPLIHVVESLIIILSLNTIAILLVILCMYLFLIWSPAAVAVMSIDFFFNVSAAAAVIWYYLDAPLCFLMLENVKTACCIFAFGTLALTFLSYFWIGHGVVGVTGLVLAAMMGTALLPGWDEPQAMLAGATTLFVVCVFFSRINNNDEGNFAACHLQLVRRYFHAAVSTVTLGSAFFGSYLLPAICIPEAFSAPVTALLFLFLLGLFKELEPEILTFTDRAFFNIVPAKAHAD
eukprot:TRINITY_DN11234_c0_g1_i1.p1 TRINITY_DN11234_c0_g1~~TRINITY_DN11234_c0_g1_i1.p1  ORF type:complete len:528 (+),score=70.35 TRINITY_DN11234_c0_g1_i1:89-1672(+)